MGEEIIFGGVTIDCKEPKSLSDFYIRMLQWEKTYEDDGFVLIRYKTSGKTCRMKENDTITI